MPCVIQYDDFGNINATVHRPAKMEKPAHKRQLEYKDECPPIDGMRVNLETMKLEKIPPKPAVDEKE